MSAIVAFGSKVLFETWKCDTCETNHHYHGKADRNAICVQEREKTVEERWADVD